MISDLGVDAEYNNQPPFAGGSNEGKKYWVERRRWIISKGGESKKYEPDSHKNERERNDKEYERRNHN